MFVFQTVCGGKGLGPWHEQRATPPSGVVLNLQPSGSSVLIGKSLGKAIAGASDLLAKFDGCQGLEVRKKNLKAYRLA
eukprot:11157775-Lingulodinium_polyedra.AAC.1